MTLEDIILRTLDEASFAETSAVFASTSAALANEMHGTVDRLELFRDVAELGFAVGEECKAEHFADLYVEAVVEAMQLKARLEAVLAYGERLIARETT